MSEDLKEVLGGEKRKKESEAAQANTPQASEAKVEMTFSQLQALINSITEQQNQRMTQALDRFAEALIESKKPYIDPKQAQNDAMMRQQMKEERIRQIERIKASQEWCEHLQGSNQLSKIPGQLTCIVRHRLDTGEIIGICTNCQRIFRLGDPDYSKQMRRASGNELSSAGQRQFLDPTAVIKAGQGQ